MTKEYLEYLKKNDPIHYSEMMGDPVTGLPVNRSSGLSALLLILFLIVIGVLIGVVLK